MKDMTDDGIPGKLLHVFPVHDLVVEVIAQEDEEERDDKAEEEGDHIVEALLGRDGAMPFVYGQVDDLRVVEGAGQRYLRFGAFLQEVGIE